jgi:hypothetical protein
MTDEWFGFCVDDKAWEGKLNLVAEMNLGYNRLEYMTNGSFSSKESWLQWLEWVVDLPLDDPKFINSYYDWGRPMENHAVWGRYIDDAKRVDFIWYTLRKNPEMMLTSNDMFQIL